MLAYMCKYCGRFTISPLKNEFEEHFCSQECYEKYCERNGYETHREMLKFIK